MDSVTILNAYTETVGVGNSQLLNGKLELEKSAEKFIKEHDC